MSYIVSKLLQVNGLVLGLSLAAIVKSDLKNNHLASFTKFPSESGSENSFGSVGHIGDKLGILGPLHLLFVLNKH